MYCDSILTKNDHIIQESVRGMYLRGVTYVLDTFLSYLAPPEIFMMDSLVARSRVRINKHKQGPVVDKFE